MIVVADASPLIALAAVDQLEVIRQRFGTVLVPPAVHAELRLDDELPGSRALRDAGWIELRSLSSEELWTALLNELDTGEAQAIALAREVGARLLLVDERRARRVAQRLGLSVVGVVGLLVDARRCGEIAALKPVLVELADRAGFRLAPSLVEHALALVGEAE